MKAARWVTLGCVLLVTAAAAAGYGWYRWSETGKGWRYEDKLASYCGGLIPYAESAVFTGLNTEVGLSRDDEYGYGEDRYRSCQVADMTVTVGLIREDAVASDTGPDIFDALDAGPSDRTPVALGGGWRGYTDMRDTAVVLPCAHRDAGREASLVVSIQGDDSHDNPEEARAMAELATGIARKAARSSSCEAGFGGRIPKVHAPGGMSAPESASGTCAGIRFPESQWIDWIKESKPSGSAPLEGCLLGESKARDEVLYGLEAAFGPYAQRLRAPSGARSGLGHSHALATASCPGSTVRAVFTISASVYAAPTKDFLRSALRAFAERSAERHGCTDLTLPG
ncbi:hypothetical protein AB0L35_37550 [Streptomyces sp. NPDC052309]|uniref:hypothetical protein n=1 Tax=Streptomyces sp. NPDC052309 TaxID=3155421 RepID=UPI0034437992